MRSKKLFPISPVTVLYRLQLYYYSGSSDWLHRETVLTVHTRAGAGLEEAAEPGQDSRLERAIQTK